jgi:deazaflavin-dependent oxidoreductase (nitroreductase family)
MLPLASMRATRYRDMVTDHCSRIRPKPTWARALGMLRVDAPDRTYDVAIVGAGPAGLSTLASVSARDAVRWAQCGASRGGDATSAASRRCRMAEYIPSPREWVRDQVELYERSGGTQGTTLRDTGLPVIILTHTGNKTDAIRKTPLMRVKDGVNYVLVGSLGGAPTHPVRVYNLRANPAIELRDHTVVQPMRAREVVDQAERTRLWDLAVAAYPPYADYQRRTTRRIPIFVAEPLPDRRVVSRGCG